MDIGVDLDGMDLGSETSVLFNRRLEGTIEISWVGLYFNWAGADMVT